MGIIAFVPARCGSKSIPLKNIKPFCGQPLIYWNLKALHDVRAIDEIIVATDCDQIADKVKSFNFPLVKIFRRSPENASDTASTESVMLEFLNASAHGCKDDDLFILSQLTSPFTTSKHFEEALMQLRKEEKDSLLSCVRIKRFFWNENGVPQNYDHRQRPRRQDFNGTLLENGAFYINRIGNIRRDKNRLSGKIAVYEMPDHAQIEIDEPDDWAIAEQFMYRHMLKPGKKNVKLFATDVDGVLTDAGMYYSEYGDELKKFNTRDGKGFELLRNAGIKTAIITSENTKMVERRAAKLKVDYLYQGREHNGKLNSLQEICAKESIDLAEVAYIGDDINCIELLSKVGWAACPADAAASVKDIAGISILSRCGGDGVVREFIEMLLLNHKVNA